MCRTAVLLVGMLVLAGCVPSESKIELVQPNAFDTASTAAPTQVCATPASTEAAARVDQIGRKIVAANAQFGLKPLFRTIGAPTLEVFHHGTTEIVITEGLVRQCPADERLAAVLCHELGKMMVEREQLAGPRARAPELRPPPDVRVGTDYAGSLEASPDMTRVAELEKYSPRRKHNQTVQLPDPTKLAQFMLANAGYQAQDLDAIASLLQEADKNSTFERQLNAGHPGSTSSKR